MKRGQYFFIALISATVTFACLTAFVNPKYSGLRYGYGPHHGGWHRGYYEPYPYDRNQSDSIDRERWHY